MSSGNPIHSLTRPSQGTEEHTENMTQPPKSTVNQAEASPPPNTVEDHTNERSNPKRKDKGKKRALEDEGEREGDNKKPVYTRSPEEEALEEAKWVVDWDLIRNFISEDPRPAQPPQVICDAPSIASVAQPETELDAAGCCNPISAFGDLIEGTFYGQHGSESASPQDYFEPRLSADAAYNACDRHSNEDEADVLAPPTPEQPQAHVDATCAASNNEQLAAVPQDAVSTHEQEVHRYVNDYSEFAMGDSAPHYIASPRQPTPGPSRSNDTPQSMTLQESGINGSNSDGARPKSSVRLPSVSLKFRPFTPVLAEPSQPETPAPPRASYMCQWHRSDNDQNIICGQIFGSYDELVTHLAASGNGHDISHKNDQGRCSCRWLERNRRGEWTRCKHYENGLANFPTLKNHLKTHPSLKTKGSAFIPASPKKPKASKASRNRPKQNENRRSEGNEAI
ncbi:hypothetical protein VNI00_014035 [Paramarasmius palmivorus]|uniref:C2H2-type domain-containing protein n=1 Tax=Paramarasmius palmivorus TaxID=297713 RepID=A0AAW0BUD1_9AGAR